MKTERIKLQNINDKYCLTTKEMGFILAGRLSNIFKHKDHIVVKRVGGENIVEKTDKYYGDPTALSGINEVVIVQIKHDNNTLTYNSDGTFLSFKEGCEISLIQTTNEKEFVEEIVSDISIYFELSIKLKERFNIPLSRKQVYEA